HCDLVEEVLLAPKGRLARYATWSLGMLRGLPPWAMSCRSEEYAERLRRLVDAWEPEVVEIHLQAMAQCVGVLHEADVASILVDYDPGSAWADEVRGRTAGLRRIARWA